MENEVPGIVPVLAQLSGLSKNVETAYFCHPSVQHIFKRKDHGGFCGYLNIQMQISYMQGARINGHERFGSCIPSILVIQDMIENAWEMGINTLDKAKTGGVRGTRKWIGAPEVCLLYVTPHKSSIAEQFHVEEGLLLHYWQAAATNHLCPSLEISSLS